MKAFLRFLVFFLTGHPLPKAGDDSRQYEYAQTAPIAEDVQPQLQTVYQQDPVSVIWYSVLTPREQQIVAYVCLGQRNHEIAGLLGIAPGTVKAHLENIYKKLKVRDRGKVRLMFNGWDFQTWLMDQQIAATARQQTRTHG